ncbi:protein phosphatase CheZ [Roseateles sp.]|uniref:protein phosphatase CheZ n=1 Tax=Roseateles sp. TaxID=1971397 RepID=UPI0025FC0B91|nr:protein phosphatase CheZ [Roseateles sp.]MBV8037783.1 protein phosphatase CheZ [Roseateles sp.]
MSDASIQAMIRADAAKILHNVVDELPDARERLAYVRSMTEQAATKVLNLVEAAQADAEAVRKKGRELSDALNRLALSSNISQERARALMKLCAAYAADAASFASREKSLHTEIMMSQDFQDLSGQVINKVSRMLERAEPPLKDLIDSLPPPPAVDSTTMELGGVQTPDKALKQDDVDDLLASLGF